MIRKTPALFAILFLFALVCITGCTNSIDVNSRDDEGNTPLMDAVRENDFDKAKELIDKGSDVNAEDNSGNTPLNTAINNSGEGTAMIELLLEAGAAQSINKGDKLFGDTPLMNAVIAGRADCFDMLLEYGADISVTDKLAGNSLLHTAVRYGQFGLVSKLITELEFDPNTKNKFGRTPVMEIFDAIDTSSQDLIDMIELLEQHGADLEVRDRDNYSLLDHAKDFQRTDIVNYLLERDLK